MNIYDCLFRLIFDSNAGYLILRLGSSVNDADDRCKLLERKKDDLLTRFAFQF